MKQSLTLLCLVTWYVSAPGPSLRNANTFGEWHAPVNAGPPINTPDYDDTYAILSRDQLTMYFTSNRPGSLGDDLWVAKRGSVNDPWGTPENMAQINSPAADSLPMLSYDEHVMFFSSTRGGGCGGTDIWMARRRAARSEDWGIPTNLGCVLNTTHMETAPAFFENPETGGITLFFGSNRPGGLGDFDVYASVVGEDRYFGPGSLVSTLSSPGRDTRIFVRKDGLESFITSNRTGGVGQIDIWTSTRTSLSEDWPTPDDVPGPVNSECDDGSPWLSRDGTTLYFFSTRPGPVCGDRDIWFVTRAKIDDENSTRAMIVRFWNRINPFS